MTGRRDAFAARREAMGFTQESFAIALGVELSTVGRWERGTLTPQPGRRARIAKALGITLEQLNELLSPSQAGNSSVGTSIPPGPSGPPHPQEHGDAGTVPGAIIDTDHDREGARCARPTAPTARTNRSPLEYIHAEVGRLATNYVSRPLSDLSMNIHELCEDVFRLVEKGRYPHLTRELYVEASRLGGLQAHLCLDLGRYRAAHTHAHTAFLGAELAGHNGMRAWVRGLQSLIAYWNGHLADAVEFAQDGVRYRPHGSIAARLPSLEARASAARGDKNGALTALQRAERARFAADHEHDAGVFTFPAAKQAVYAGTALLTLGDQESVARAVQQSSQALRIYDVAAPEERSSGDMLAARLDLGRAYLSRSDLDGLDDQLQVVLAVPQVLRTASIIKRAATLGRYLDTGRFARSPQARRLRREIDSFCAQAPALSPTHCVELP
ncbi:helix-turn-helix transcriptional regulator [Haloechinothrix sp. YIM 98757]|uniref:Helix-turn-helix transcriptional regulator n=1 Tax=Haloechinothrix aidingensis TaxID=2752311 RepID=A0A838AD90_9PSEU|nr:helix-turn-helix transcriptional regulator [Haloechinothrix aidingensis]